LTKNGSTFKFLNRAQSGPDVSELLIVLPMQIDFIKKACIKISKN